MKTSDLLSEFSDIVLLDPDISITQLQRDNEGFTLSLLGRGSLIEVEFEYGGDIFATIDCDELYHRWLVYPNSTDLKACFRKIKNLVSD